MRRTTTLLVAIATLTLSLPTFAPTAAATECDDEPAHTEEIVVLGIVGADLNDSASSTPYRRTIVCDGGHATEVSVQAPTQTNGAFVRVRETSNGGTTYTQIVGWTGASASQSGCAVAANKTCVVTGVMLQAWVNGDLAGDGVGTL